MEETEPFAARRAKCASRGLGVTGIAFPAFNLDKRQAAIDPGLSDAGRMKGAIVKTTSPGF